MACSCSHEPAPPKPNSKFRTALWIALFINLAMFVVELIGGTYAHSSALWADALDFFGDAVNYGISLAVLGASLYWRATVALLKGVTMALFGIVVIGKVIYAYLQGIPPEAITMGVIGVAALIANVTTAVILYAFRDGDSNMKSVWLCSRNDAIGNVAVILAAIGVLGTGSLWPDIIVAVIMASLGLTAGYQIVKQAINERKNYTVV
ncbi:cation diffusion facilitator family transporter [Acinetobacter bohemicus]|uniref:Cation diffusion facilitator family transporter n=1 Tax=Acinetobacter lwoffii TaxID=28090 RepID=A0A9D2UTZ6_ACILW|nr:MULTISPECIES: cation diffusion facilitator family transporter [Acinetobacter]MDM1782462.1 cation transporter [Acinetobacter indicus]HJF28558.1 cation diffusion facilitator family transporter [Acinetobacter lwoffii]MCO8043265.1 cation diffusion facilitator family transporter [Acinetobacter sp. S4400-12]MCO8046105.1 cation diffusion facilitator family transporter [Acinetobacter sp. S4397-1]MCU7224074.1 cation diffusion facilitator family transporter [Acinetobacter bohemicus]